MNQPQNVANMQDHLQRFLDTQPAQPEQQPAGGKEEPPFRKHATEPENFSVTPLELEAHLNKFVIGQGDGVSVLATKIATHYNRMRLEISRPDLPHIVGNIKPNVILVGPTGVGKTYIVKLIADFIKVPFVKGDATKFSETGYVGGDVEDLVRELVRVSGGDIPTAERGIIYIDEIDKIAAASNSTGLDVSRSGVQRNLLKIMEETEVDMKVPHDIASQMEAVMELQRTGKADPKKVNTRNILFVVSGAFSKLDEIVKRRLRGGTIGFGKVHNGGVDEADWSQHIHAQDLIEYGFETEFVGRLPVLVRLSKLGVEELYEILKSPNSAVVEGKRRDFLSYGIELTFTDEAYRLLAELAAIEGTGARGILAVIEKLLIPFEKYLPGRVSKFEVTSETVEHPEEELERLLLHSSVEAFCYAMRIEHNLEIKIAEDAVEYLREQCLDSGIPANRLMKELLKNYPYGLKLMGISEFEVTAEILRRPQEYLDTATKTWFAARSKEGGES